MYCWYFHRVSASPSRWDVLNSSLRAAYACFQTRLCSSFIRPKMAFHCGSSGSSPRSGPVVSGSSFRS